MFILRNVSIEYLFYYFLFFFTFSYSCKILWSYFLTTKTFVLSSIESVGVNFSLFNTCINISDYYLFFRFKPFGEEQWSENTWVLTKSKRNRKRERKAKEKKTLGWKRNKKRNFEGKKKIFDQLFFFNIQKILALLVASIL